MRLVLVVAIAALLAPAALAAPGGHVRLVGTTVVGSGFQPREHLAVTLRTASAHWTKRVVASARGSFTLRFAIPVAAGGCGGYSLVAVGSKGDRAAWKSPPKPCGALPGP